MQRASSSSHEAEGDRKLASVGVRTRGRGFLLRERTFSRDHLRPSAANFMRVCMTAFASRCSTRTWKLAAWVTLIIAGMRVVGGPGAGGAAARGAAAVGFRGEAPAGGSRNELKMFREQNLSRNEAWFVKIRKQMSTEKQNNKMISTKHLSKILFHYF